jgi:mannose-1-phosphate guanylyltransferase / mannose-6-phosphate isomerase
MVVLSSDHLILKPQKFLKILDQAAAAARKGFLVTLGIRPTRPETGYGYLKIGSRLPANNSGIKYLRVEAFLEKPDEKKAEEYFRSRRFLWNSGIFIWKAGVILEEMKTYLPFLYSNIRKITGKNIGRIWKRLPAISIDYGIMEKSRKVVTIPADIQWTDLGSWQALSQVIKKDKDGNIIKGDCIDLDSKNIFVMGSDRLITTIGLQDLVLVDTPDALLVCHKDLSQKVKDIVDILKKGRRQEHILHKTVKRPWGSYTVLKWGQGFKIKIVEIEPGQRLSLQLHHRRAEHWVVVEGVARVRKGNMVRLVKANESIYIPANKLHRLENPRKTPLKIVEVQTGKYLEEDDIARFQDDYERHHA